MSPKRGKKLRSYTLKDLIEDLETGDFTSFKPLWLPKLFGWDGAEVTIQGAKRRLLIEAIKRNAFRAATTLVKHCKATLKEKNRGLLELCAEPLRMPEERLDFAQVLLDHGANADSADSQRRTCLHLCLENNAELELMSALALPGNVNLLDREGNSVLHKAILANNDRVVRMLLFNGANPNSLDGKGRLPLVMAAHLPQDTCLRSILRHGAKIDHQDINGRSALASIENPSASMMFLRQGLRSDTQDSDGVAPLHTAFGLWCRWCRGENLSILLFREESLADLLVSQASSVDLKDKNGRTALHYACEVPHIPAPEFVEYLIKRGAALETVDNNGWTPLHVAVASGNYATAARLIELGADTDVRDPRGRTPLHVMGMDSLASKHYPYQDLSHAIRRIAFGSKNKSTQTYVAPLSEMSSQTDHDSHYIKDATLDNDRSPLVDLFLHHGFDFRTLDNSGKMTFFLALNDTMHFQMVHAAACQGLLG